MIPIIFMCAVSLLACFACAIYWHHGFEAGVIEGRKERLRDTAAAYTRTIRQLNLTLNDLPIPEVVRVLNQGETYDKVGALLAADLGRHDKRFGDLMAQKAEWSTR